MIRGFAILIALTMSSAAYANASMFYYLSIAKEPVVVVPKPVTPNGTTSPYTGPKIGPSSDATPAASEIKTTEIPVCTGVTEADLEQTARLELVVTDDGKTCVVPFKAVL